MLATRGVFGLGMLVGGFLAVVFYRKRNPLVRLTSGLGARLGAMSGAIAYGILVLLLAISVTLFHAGGKLREAMMQAIQQAVARSSDPQATQMLEWFRTPQGMAVLLIAGIIFAFLFFVAISSIGGALGAVMLRNKEQRPEKQDNRHERSDHSGAPEDHQNSFK